MLFAKAKGAAMSSNIRDRDFLLIVVIAILAITVLWVTIRIIIRLMSTV